MVLHQPGKLPLLFFQRFLLRFGGLGAVMAELLFQLSDRGVCRLRGGAPLTFILFVLLDHSP